MIGHKQTKETREKISDTLKRYIKTPEHRKNLSISLMNNKCSKDRILTGIHKKRISESLKGRNLSLEHRKKISEIQRGKTYEEKYGIKRAEEIKRKMSHPAWNKGLKGFLSKEKHYNWQNGKSFEPYGLEFDNKLKAQIRQRDNYRCQQCFRHQDEIFVKWKNGKIINEKMHIHHIDFNKQNNHPNNLISLCRTCHAQTLFNREDWINYFQEKMEDR